MSESLSLEQVQNFLGKPFKMKQKGADGVEVEFEFQQLGVKEGLSDVIDIYNKFLKNNNEMDKELMDLATPLIELMVKKSYPGWSDELREGFLQRNFIWLMNILFQANMLMLMEPILGKQIDAQLEEQMQRQRESLKDGQRTNPVKTEVK